MSGTMPERPWLAHYPEGVPTTLTYPPGTLSDMLQKTASTYPDRDALIFFGRRTTYASLLDQVRRLAGGLRRLGVKKGTRVAIMLPNCPQAVVAYYAVLWLGAVGVQVNPLYTANEARAQLLDAGTTHLIVLDLFYPRVAGLRGQPLAHIIVTGIQEELPFPLSILFPLGARRQGQSTRVPPAPGVTRWRRVLDAEPVAAPEPVDPREDLALLQYTGGTTGTSKGAMLTHFNLIANCTQIRAWMQRPEGEALRVLAALPFFHVYGMTAVMNYSVFTGATMILVPRFEAGSVLKLIQKHRPQVFPGAPTMYVAINHHPDVQRYDLSSVEVCVSGAAPLPVEVQETFERLTGGRLVEGYGLTEASPVTHANPIRGRRKVGSIGLPWPDTDCRIVDPDTRRELPPGEVGELAVRGPQVMKGYWHQPEETARDLQEGWLYTGDLARMDEEGYFYIVDRKKDVIIAGGFNIYPREVEDVLYEHPAVQEASVVGVPDPYRGETVKAFVVLKEGRTASPEELDAHCRERLASFKVPRLYEFRSKLPKSLVGKVLRRVLLEEELGRQAGQAQAAGGETRG